MSQGQRRLAAIMFTDMVGYTALTQSNESRALEVLERHNRLLRPFFPKFNGREVKAIGDSFLIEFDSALDAVNCAVEIQRFLHDYNVSSRDEWKITLRIGIHLGDVVHQGGDVFGDAVNIASRLQPLSEPEGICVSDQVFGQIRNKVPQTFLRMKPRDLKNVSFPIDVYKVVMPWEGEPVVSPLELDSRRIAVLPFANMSPDPNDAYFSDGMTEELIASLSSVKEFTVIARTSVMKYKAGTKGVNEIGRELSAGTLVEGSVRKAGNRIRVTVQLVNSSTEGHLWAENYDRSLDDVFAVQSDIARRVADSLSVKILAKEGARMDKKPTENTEAYLLYLKGRQHWNKRSKDDIRRAMEYFQLAIDTDSSFALAFVGLADCWSTLASWGHISASEAAPRIREAALRAMELDNELAEVHATYAVYLALFEWKWGEAELEFKRSIELNPSYASAHQWYSYSVLRFARREDEELREAKRGLDLDPLSPMMSINVAQTFYFREQYDQALKYIEKARAIDPDFRPAYLWEGFVRLAKSDYDEGIELIERAWRESRDESKAKLEIATAYARTGRVEDARRLVAEIEEAKDRESIQPGDFADLYCALGEADKMFEFLGLAARQKGYGVPWRLLGPEYKPYRHDPRFEALEKEVGIPVSQ